MSDREHRSAAIEVLPVGGLPEVQAGQRVGELISAAVELRGGDIVVVSQKVVSKAEARIRRLAEVEAGTAALELAARVRKNPALVQVILDETRSIVRAAPGVLIVETHGGWVCANAGVDASNVVEEGTVVLLPKDADASARRIRAEIGAPSPAVVIADSFGRPWRLGQTDVAIGAAGLRVIDDWREKTDRNGRKLAATAIAVADQVAAAADLARDKTSGVPAAVVRGLQRHVCNEDGPGAGALQRPRSKDLFR